MEPRWKIAELSAVVQQVLASAGQAEQPSGRVRDLPDTRAIRYYTTLALIDRPLEMRGRTAYYGPRHVWQLLAIKQLQAGGLSLVDIQERLAGADDRALKKLARVPERLVREAGASGQAMPQPQSAAPRTNFWADPPAAAAERSMAEAPPQQAEESPAVCRAWHIKLGEGATLVLEGLDPEHLGRDKLAAVERAARGFIQQWRHLVAQQPSSDRSKAQSPPIAQNGGRTRGALSRGGGAERSRS